MPKDRSEQLQIKGLADFQKALKAIDLARDLKVLHKKVADMVATGAVARATGLGGVAAKSASTIKAAAQQRQASVSIGNERAPWALGAEFGGRGRPTTQQFLPHLGTTGYALYPTVRATREAQIELYADGIGELSRHAFPN